MPRQKKRGGRGHPWSAIYSRSGQYRNGVTTDALRERENGRAAPCRTLADMTPDEIAQLEHELGAKVSKARRASR